MYLHFNIDIPTQYIFTLFIDPSTRAVYDTRSIFQVKFNRFEFRVFLLD